MSKILIELDKARAERLVELLKERGADENNFMLKQVKPQLEGTVREPEELTEDERDALSDIVIEYEMDMLERYGDHLKPGMAMSREGKAIALAKSAIRKILGNDFGAQTKK